MSLFTSPLKGLLAGLAVLLLPLNAFLLWSNGSMVSRMKASIVPPHLVDVGGRFVDMRGLYTYPGVGAHAMPRDSLGNPIFGSLNLVVYFSARTTCPMNLEEAGIYRRILPVMQERNQTMVAVASPSDSPMVAEFLRTAGLEIPLLIAMPDEEMSLERIGLSSRVMPFKVIYDSTLSAVYMRGALSTPEAQVDFENAITFLSDAFAEPDHRTTP